MIKMVEQAESYIRNCYFLSKKGDDEPPYILVVEKNGDAKIYLDGYAIIPMEKYDRLISPWWILISVWVGLCIGFAANALFNLVAV